MSKTQLSAGRVSSSEYGERHARQSLQMDLFDVPWEYSTGYLVLEEMHIKKGLLDTLELPLALAHGVIGRLEIRIPWTNLLREPIVVAVDQVFLVVEPKFKWDADAVKRREQAIKSAKIAAADLLRNLPLDDAASAPAPAEGSSKASWVSGLKKWLTDSFITRIFDSLQIHIREVHVRYEDHLSQPGAPFYVGAVIESLHAETGRPKPGHLQGSGSSSSGGVVARRRNGAKPVGGVLGRDTVPEDEQVTSGGGRDSLVKKELNLNQLAVYWNPAEDGNPCSMHLSDIPVEQAEVVLSRLIARKNQVNASKEGAAEELLASGEKLRHRYILEPVDMKARLTLNVDPKDRSQPKCQAQVEVGAMSGRLEDFQVKGGMYLGAALSRYDEVGRYFKYRPEVPVRVDPSAWWRFAFKVVVERLRAERGWRQAFPDIARRRKKRLEYISLWQKSRGWATSWDEDIAGYDELRPPRSPTSSVGISQMCSSPGSTASSAPSSAPVLSSLESSGEEVDTEAPVWPAGINGRRTVARSRTRRAAAHEEVVAAKTKLEELESELSAEDVIFFRAMAEREEAQKFGRVRKGAGNRWGIGDWVSWAFGASDHSLLEEKGEQESIEDELRRVYASVYPDPPRSSTASPPPPSGAAPGDERTESLDLEGWLAISLSLHAEEGGMVLANSGTSVSRNPEVIPSRSGARPFAGVRFRGFRLCAKLLGDDMDGVLASVTLDDLSVHEIQGNNARSRDQGLTSGGQPFARGGDEDTAEFSSTPIIARRVRPTVGGGSGAESSSRLPLFDMHFEVNRNDPEYDSRVYLDVNQVEAMISPTAVWLEEAMMFGQTPAELEHRATLKLAASNQLRNIRAQLESKLEMVMSKRLRTYLDLKVKAPLVAVSVDLNSLTSIDRRSSGRPSNNRSAFAADPAVASADASQQTPGYGTQEAVESRGGQGAVSGVRRRGWAVRTGALAAEHLIIDLGDISFSTASLARLKRDMGGRGSVAVSGAASTSTDSGSRRVGSFSSSEYGRGDEWELGSGSSNDVSSTARRRRARASSDVAALAVEGWHANFYDMYNIGVGRVGVLLARSHGVEFGGDGVEGLLGRRAASIDTGTLKGNVDKGVVSGDGVTRRWLVCPFDVKVEFHLSVIPRDPNISQLKVYADLSGLHVRLSEDKLRRLAGMSSAISAQSAALQASRIANQPPGIQRRPDELDDRNAGSMSGAQSGLASFLEFQRALSSRFDHLHQAPDSSPTVMTPRSINSPGRRGLKEQSLIWEVGGGSGSGSANDDGEFASAWGGSSSRGSNIEGITRSIFGSDHGSMVHPLPRSSSAESEFYDAMEGGSAVDGSEYLPPVMAAEAGASQQGIGDTGSRYERCRTGVFEEKEEDLSGSAGDTSIGRQSEMDDSLEFEDARDPIAEMDEALMAKEAEKAELMKQRQKIREQLARPELAGEELERVRRLDHEVVVLRLNPTVSIATPEAVANPNPQLASAEVSKSLEACEDGLKGLEIELEELTEVFENAGRQTRTDTGVDEFGFPSTPPRRVWGGQSQEQDIVNGGQDAFATPPGALAVQQAVSVGPNREIIMCGLTMPLVQVDLLQDKSDTAFEGKVEPLSRRARVTARDGRDPSRRGRSGRQGSAEGGGVMGDATEEEQQEVVSLRLVGLGMQLHSKSYSARFSFSMQDLDLEDRLRASQTANGESSCPAAAGAVTGDAAKGGSVARNKTENAFSPTTKSAQKAIAVGGGDGGLLGGDMATSRPRLFLWKRADRPSRRAVTFSVGAADDDGVQSHSTDPAAGVATNGLETRGPVAVAASAGGGQSEGSGRGADVVLQPSERISRPDFIQMSYAMKKVPVGGKDRGLGVALRGTRRGTQSVQETHRVKLLVGALEINLEQETVLALVRIASSATAAPPSPPVLSDNLGGHVGVADSSRTSSAPHTEGRQSDDAGALGGRIRGDGPSVPVLAQGVSVTLAVDVSALSVALREAGHNVAAVTACAAHCKVNAESTRVKAIASLGELSVLNLLGHPTPPPATTSLAARAAQREDAMRGLDCNRRDGGSSIWLDPVIAQAQGATGPIFEVALAVASSEAHGHSGNLRDVGGASRGSEARIKVKVDNMRTAISIPFVESMARFVLTGPLVTHLLKNRVAARDAKNMAPSERAPSLQTPPSLPSETPSVAANGEARGMEGASDTDGETKRGPSLPGVPNDLAEPSREAGDLPHKRLQRSNWEKIVSLKVGLEVSDYALDIPLDRNTEDSKINRVTAEIGHLLASAVWTQSVMGNSSDSNGLPQGDHRRDMGSLHVETLLSSAAIKVLPEGFHLLQPVHSRAVVVIPLVDGTGVASYAEGVHGVQGFHDGGHDELAEKLQEKCNLAFTECLPSRPSLSFEGAARGAERPQVRVTVSPIFVKLAESHMFDLACFGVEAFTRLTKVSEILTLPSWKTLLSHSPSSLRTPGSGLGDSATHATSASISVEEREGRPSRRSGEAESGRSELPQRANSSSGTHQGLDGQIRGSVGEHADEVLDRESPPRFQGGESPTASNGPASAPVPPALFGTLVVDGVHLLLLTDPVEGDSGAAANAGGPGADASGDALDRCASGVPEPLSSGAFLMYTPVMLFKLQGVGVGVDVVRAPLVPSDRSSSSREISSGAGVESTGSRLRAELAIQSMHLMDVSAQRRGLLMHLIEGRVGGVPPVGEEEMVTGGGGNGFDDDRILPTGWWNQGRCGESAQGYGEQVLCRALMCSTSNTVSVDSHLAFGRFMLLSAPILDTLMLVSRLRHGVTMYYHAFVRDVEGEGHLAESASSVVRTFAGSGSRSYDREVPPLTGAPPTYSGGAHRHGDMPTRRNDNGRTISLPQGIAGGHLDMFDQQNNGERHAQRGCVRQRAARVLGGAKLANFRWLERIQLSFSASHTQLCIPDGAGVKPTATAQGTELSAPQVAPNVLSAVDQSVQDVEAIVASCGSCHMAITVVAHRLSAAATSDVGMEPTISNSDQVEPLNVDSNAMGEEKKGHEADDIPDPDSLARDDGDVEANDSPVGDPVEEAPPGDEICVMSVCADEVEIFVARLSTPDLGAQTDPLLVFASDLCNRAREGSGETKASDTPYGYVPSMDERVPNCPRNPGTPPNITRVLREHASLEDSMVTSSSARNASEIGGETLGTDAAPDISGRESVSSIEGGGGGRHARGRGSRRTTENLIFPFSLNIRHVLHLLTLNTPATSSTSPLLSHVDAEVSVVEVACLLDFPLATRILQNSIVPPAEGLPAFAEERGRFWDDQPQDEVNYSRSAETHGEGRQATMRSSGATTNRQAHVSMGVERDASAGLGIVSELAALWDCRCALEMEGLRLIAINNFYRQKRPFVKISVQPISGKLTASGADRSLQASISARARSEYYNTRLMAWEPFLEEWGTQVKVEVCAREHHDSELTAVDIGRRTVSFREGNVRGNQQQTAGRPGRATQEEQELRAPSLGRPREGNAEEGLNVRVSVASDKVINFNLTESFMENLAATIHARQRKGGKLEDAWAGDVSDESFSLHLLRNETGLPLFCSAHCDPVGGGGGTKGDVGGGSPPLHLSVGEEHPMPSFSDPTSFPLEASDGDANAVVEVEVEIPIREEAGAGVAREVERIAPASSHQGSERCPSEAARRSPSAGRRSPFEVQGVDSATCRSSEVSWSSRMGGDDRGRRQRPVRWIMLEFKDTEEGASAGAAPVATTRWRSLRPIGVDDVGQRLATINISSADASPSLHKERRARSSNRSLRQPRSWSWTRGTNHSKARRVAAGRPRAVKVVTEVESHHGVKVVRIRSQAKVVNSAGDISLHVGVVDVERNEEKRSQSPGDGGGRRFVWETVIHPGQSCPVPATMAEVVVEGRHPLIVRPIACRPAGAVRTSARSSDINTSGGVRAGDAPGHGLSDDFEEAVLALPALTRRREGTNGASYHRTVEFASRSPAPRRRTLVESHGTGRSIFCGVSVAREIPGRSERRGERNGRKTGLVTVVSFEPSMSLTNLLATPVDVVLSRPSRGSGVNGNSLAACLSFGKTSEGAAWSGTVERGTAMSWHECSPREQVSMAIRVPGFGWSNAVILPLPSNLDGDDEDDWVMSPSAIRDGGEAWTGGARSTSTTQKSRGQPWRERIEGTTKRRAEASSSDVQIALENSEGATLRVNAVVTFLASELRQVSLWVPYWVVNATSLPLTLQHYYPAPPSGIIHGTSDEIDSTTSLEWQLPAALESNLNPSGASPATHDDSGKESGSFGAGVNSRGREDRRRGVETQQLGGERRRQPPSSGGDDLVRFKPLMLPHSDPEQHKQERVRLRLGVEGSTWSDSFGLDQVGSGSSLELSGEPTARESSRSLKRAERRAYAVGISMKAAPTPFGRTKVVALTPRYMIINATQYAVEVQQAGLGPGIEPLKVASGGQASFHWPKAGARGWLGGAGTGAGSKRRRLIARRVGEGWEWSGEMLPEGGGDVTLRVRNSRTREVAFVRISSRAKDSLFQLVFRDELPSFAPYRIENLSLETLTLRQAGVDVVETLTPYRSCSYSWDEPLGERALVIERLVGKPPRRHRGLTPAVPTAAGAATLGVVAGGAERDGTRRGRAGVGGDFPSVFVGVYGLDLLRPPAVVGRLRIETTADGPTRTLRFTDARSASVWRSSGAPSAPVSGPPRVSLAANIRLAGVGLSVIDAYPRELLYLTLGEVALDYLRGGQGEGIHANIGKLQVDNQLLVTPYPALLYPIAEALPPRHPAVRLCEGQTLLPTLTPGGSARNDPESDGDRKACFELILHRELGYAWVNFVRLISVRVAPMDLNLDMALVDAFLEVSTRMTELIDLAGAIDNADPASTSDSPTAPSVSLGIPVSIESLDRTVSTVSAESGPPNKVYLEELAISPIRLHVSFTSGSHGATLEHLQPLGEGMVGGSGSGGASITGALLRAMGTTLGQIENAPLVLKPVELTHIFDSPDELSRMLLVHYRRQAVRQVFNVMGSSKLLGSPLGLFSNIGTGVKDFFYEPLAGLSRSPFGFAFGVFRGTSSLVRRTLYSVTDTTDRIVSSVSSGILASGAVDVVVRGGSGVVRPYGPLDGVLLGVAGAVREPLLGLRSGGFMGMATGLLTGWVGLVLRPTYGTMMSTSQLCQVVSSYLDPRLDSEQKLRMIRFRPPRFFRSRQQVLSAYSREENIGEELLSRVHMGRYRSDGYVWHTTVKDMIVLVTWRRIIMLHGDADRRENASPTTRRNSYGVVEWEVDFGLVVWLETNEQGGRENQAQALRTSTNTQQQVRAGIEGGNSDVDGGGSGASVLVYYVPDLYGDSRSESRDRRIGSKLPALRFERRVVLCVDREQALQINRVLWGQVHARASTSSL